MAERVEKAMNRDGGNNLLVMVIKVLTTTKTNYGVTRHVNLGRAREIAKRSGQITRALLCRKPELPKRR